MTEALALRHRPLPTGRHFPFPAIAQDTGLPGSPRPSSARAGCLQNQWCVWPWLPGWDSLLLVIRDRGLDVGSVRVFFLSQGADECLSWKQPGCPVGLSASEWRATDSSLALWGCWQCLAGAWCHWPGLTSESRCPSAWCSVPVAPPSGQLGLTQLWTEGREALPSAPCPGGPASATPSRLCCHPAGSRAWFMLWSRDVSSLGRPRCGVGPAHSFPQGLSPGPAAALRPAALGWGPRG